MCERFFTSSVTQRGNRRGTTFFEAGDDALYLDLLSDAAARARTEAWAYWLMPNHVHLILVPSDEDGLRRTLADLHRRTTGFVNARTTGHLWQGRYGSVTIRAWLTRPAWSDRTCR